MVAERTAETEHREFKSTIQGGSKSPDWSHKLALSVAALLNHRGGDLIFGVSTEKSAGVDVATGFTDKWASESIGEDQLREALRNRLEPPEAASSVVVDPPASFTDVGKTILCTRVSVPPWPHGIVAVLNEDRKGEVESRNRRLDYAFPLRQGAGRIYLSLAEANLRSDSDARRIELLLLDLQDKTKKFVLAGGIGVVIDGSVVPAHRPSGTFDGVLSEVGPNSIRVTMAAQTAQWLQTHTNAEKKRRLLADLNPSTRVDRSQEVARLNNLVVDGQQTAFTMSIPLRLIAAVWEDCHGGESRIFLALKGQVAWDGTGYRVIAQ